MRTLAAILAAGLLTSAGQACQGRRTMPSGFEWTASARDHIHRVDIVFEAVALPTARHDDLIVRRRAGSRASSERFAPDSSPTFPDVLTAFRVLRVWKGDLEAVEVVSGAPDWAGTSCASRFDAFEPGERYLILAMRGDNGLIETPRGDLVSLLEWERAEPGRPTEFGWQAWEPSGAVTNDWESWRERQLADWFEGAGDYQGVLERMVADGALPEPDRPQRLSTQATK